MGLSVIVPVYNGEKYIQECLKSIVNQSYRDLQIIVVNDGSKDNTELVIKNLLNKDSRIELINKKNGGVSSARNLGLSYVKKEFVTFVDSDDTLDLDMYELLMKYADNNEYDIIHCGYKRINEVGTKLVNGTSSITIQNTHEATECIIRGKMFVGALWNKVYKSNLFNNIRFDESIKINEDILINYELFKKSRKSIFIDEPKYNYFEREISACKITNQIKKSRDSLKVAEIIYNDCDSKLKKYAFNKYIGCIVSLYKAYYYSNDKNRRKKCKELRSKIKSLYGSDYDISRKNNISMKLIIYTPYLYGLLYRIYDRARVPNWDV